MHAPPSAIGHATFRGALVPRSSLMHCARPMEHVVVHAVRENGVLDCHHDGVPGEQVRQAPEQTQGSGPLRAPTLADFSSDDR